MVINKLWDRMCNTFSFAKCNGYIKLGGGYPLPLIQGLVEVDPVQRLRSADFFVVSIPSARFS